MAQPRPDRRAVPRIPSTGLVEIRFGEPAPEILEAELLEVSAQGFRAAHDSTRLEPGLDVFFRKSGELPARARVIWTHVLGDRRISGFLVLP